MTTTFSQAVTHPGTTQKLDGNRVALRGRILPETKLRANAAAAARGLTLSDYLASLIIADTGGVDPSATSQGTLNLNT